MDASSQALNLTMSSTIANLVLSFKRGRKSNELCEAAKVRTGRECEFGEIIHPFDDQGGWNEKYFGSSELTDEHRNRYSQWLILSNKDEVPSNNPVSHMKIPDITRYRVPRSGDGNLPGTSSNNSGPQDRIFFQKEFERVERRPQKLDVLAERLGLEEASQELFGSHRIVESLPSIDTDEKKQAREIYLVNMPWCLVKELMAYEPDNPYLGKNITVGRSEILVSYPTLPRESQRCKAVQVVYEKTTRYTSLYRCKRFCPEL